jgi:hypothetical protein
MKTLLVLISGTLLVGCADLTVRQQHALELGGAVGAALVLGSIQASLASHEHTDSSATAFRPVASCHRPPACN